MNNTINELMIIENEMFRQIQMALSETHGLSTLTMLWMQSIMFMQSALFFTYVKIRTR